MQDLTRPGQGPANLLQRTNMCSPKKYFDPARHIKFAGPWPRRVRSRVLVLVIGCSPLPPAEGSGSEIRWPNDGQRCDSEMAYGFFAHSFASVFVVSPKKFAGPWPGRVRTCVLVLVFGCSPLPPAEGSGSEIRWLKIFDSKMVPKSIQN